ncbi:hypothetical protein sos41_22990 [Alphaproteobacteria bacterium SO-S41]|nr:hypothetical protein sos41_22990 [Alphaproteobacteria bacterium SO-S41]
MKLLAASFAALLLAGSAAAASPHPCEADARARAPKLLKAQWDMEGAGLASKPGAPVEGSPDMAWDLSPDVTILAPIANPSGTGKYDVIELTAYVYKAEYRLRFLYAQIPDACALMGEESLDLSDPY